MSAPLILIIDDFEDNTTLLTETLKNFFPDADLRIALDGREGIEIAEQLSNQLDLVILDANLPGLSGFEVCQRLKSSDRNPLCPVLMLSAVFINNTDRIRGLESGADGYLCKPYHIEELVAQVRVLLRIKERENQLFENQRTLHSELRQAESNLEHPKQQVNTVFDTAPNPIYVLDKESEIIDINPAACHIHELKYDDIIGCNISCFIPFENLLDFQRSIERCILEKEPVEFETTLNRPMGQTLPVSISCCSTTYREQDAIILHVQDVSKRREVGEQLRAAQKMDAVGRLTGGVAHDFNNMLTSILGYAYLIKENAENSAIEEDSEQIIKAAERASRLTRQLLMFNRKQTMPLHPMEMNGVVQEIDHLLRRTLHENIELVTILDETLPYINSDEGHIEQVIINLAVNARDAMPNGGKLIIETRTDELAEPLSFQHQTVPPGRYGVLKVTDQGSGMPDEVLEQVFEPFFSTKERNSGMGMGLNIVYEIVRCSQGYVRIQSLPEEGTRVELYFPEIEIAPEIAQQMRAPANAPGGTETILLAEDEDVLRGLTADMLRSLGYEVIEARHGEEALRLALKHQDAIDLLISDVIMPCMGGPELVHNLQTNETCRLKVLFISGFTDEALALQPKGERPHELLLKPYTKPSMAQKIRDILDG